MTVTIGFVGAGGIAEWQHFDIVEARDDVEVAGICDVNQAAASEAAERFDATAYTDHEKLYDGEDLDAVFVCIPPFAHGPAEIAAAERGIDLFVEKPLALSVERAREIREAIEDAGVLAGVGYDWRYSRGVERAQELLADRTIATIEGRWWGGVPGEDGHWWREFEKSGGQIVEQATHVYDTVRLLAGDVEAVSGAGSHRIVDAVDFADSTSVTMEHESGTISHVSTTCAAEDHDAHLEVVADGATLRITEEEISGTVDGEDVEDSFDVNPYAVEVDAFVEAIAADDAGPIRSTYDDAFDTFALTMAANEALDADGRVEPATADGGADGSLESAEADQ